MDALPPWLSEDYVALLERHRRRSLPHALLIRGVAGIGKTVFARSLTHRLLCPEATAQFACSECLECRLIAAGNHPDLFWLAPQAGEDVIKVDAVREMIDWSRLTPHYQRFRIAVISPAEKLNRNAANSLLKTLEEPSAQSVFLLLTQSPGSLPATVRSRCQQVSLSVRNRVAAIEWLIEQQVTEPETALNLAGGGPFEALQQAATDSLVIRGKLFTAWQQTLLGTASIARSVEATQGIATRTCLRWFMDWIADSLRLSVDPAAAIRHGDLREALIKLGGQLKTADWFSLYDHLQSLYRSDSASYKTQTVLEGIFAAIRLRQLDRSRGAEPQ